MLLFIMFSMNRFLSCNTYLCFVQTKDWAISIVLCVSSAISVSGSQSCVFCMLWRMALFLSFAMLLRFFAAFIRSQCTSAFVYLFTLQPWNIIVFSSFCATALLMISDVHILCDELCCHHLLPSPVSSSSMPPLFSVFTRVHGTNTNINMWHRSGLTCLFFSIHAMCWLFCGCLCSNHLVYIWIMLAPRKSDLISPVFSRSFSYFRFFCPPTNLLLIYITYVPQVTLFTNLLKCVLINHKHRIRSTCALTSAQHRLRYSSFLHYQAWAWRCRGDARIDAPVSLSGRFSSRTTTTTTDTFSGTTATTPRCCRFFRAGWGSSISSNRNEQ